MLVKLAHVTLAPFEHPGIRFAGTSILFVRVAESCLGVIIMLIAIRRCDGVMKLYEVATCNVVRRR